MNDIRWRATDPLGNQIWLKERTFVEHIIGDHEDKDGAYRKMLERLAKRTILAPRYIIWDGRRRLYFDLIVEENPIRLRIMKVVVEREGAVVTWTVTRKGETVQGGEMIHDVSSEKV